jgi:hypothetical protein
VDEVVLVDVIQGSGRVTNPEGGVDTMAYHTGCQTGFIAVNLPLLVGSFLVQWILISGPGCFAEQLDKTTLAELPPLLTTGKPQIIDAGIITPSSSKSIELPVMNPKDVAIAIRGYDVSGSSAKVTLQPRELAAGQQGKLRVDLKTGDHEVGVQYRMRLYMRTVPVDRSMAQLFCDEYELSVVIRNSCSFYGQSPYLFTTPDPDAKPYVIRAVNYGATKWHEPSVGFSHPGIMNTLSETVEVIDGEERQVLYVSIDKVAFTRTFLAEERIPSHIAMEVFSKDKSRTDTVATKIGQFQVVPRVLKVLEIHPGIVNWNPASPIDITLIVESRSSHPLTSTDFVISSEGKAVPSSYEEIRPGWGKLVIPGNVLNSLATDSLLRVSVKRMNADHTIRLRRMNPTQRN